MPLTETEADVVRKMILAALEGFEQPGPLKIAEVFYGPRHNELGFRLSNGVGPGKEIVVTIHERNWR